MSVTTNERALIDSINPAGWPRPRAEATTTDGVTKTWTLPWIAPVISDYKSGETVITLDAFDVTRAFEAVEYMLCQVCGKPCRDMAFAPLNPSDIDAAGEMYSSGTPTCSLRCVKLALTLCPHFGTDAIAATFSISDVDFNPDVTCYTVGTWNQAL